MNLAPGKQLSHYEILGSIGAGGMGEVYRAKDPRLGREVAIKILPPQFSEDPERVRRFESEAKAAGILNHPNVLTVYDVGTEDGVLYVVSELLTGETLRERIGGAGIGARKAIEFGLQIAHGLAAAHERGIVHRDLKPENLFLTKDGRIKILDFGLAKLKEEEPALSEKSRLSTRDPGTRPGVVMGTVGYMSPEQVRGREVDHRTDIFSFGAILYEMLSGKRAFHRDSAADTMSAILKEDPSELTAINSGIPPALERVVRHCLEKNAEERFQSARDLAFDLEMISGATGTSSATTTSITPVRSFAFLRPVIFGLALIMAFAGGWFLAQKMTPPASSTAPAFQLNFQRLTFRRGYIPAARFAPDGQTILYSAAWNGQPEELFSTRPQSPVSRSLNLTDASLLAISSTGEMAILMNPRYLSGWERAGTLARLPIDGGAPRQVLDDVQDADWSPDGKELAVVRKMEFGYQLEYPVGKMLFKTRGWLSNPRISADNKWIAFLEHPTSGDDRGFVGVVDMHAKYKRLTHDWASESGIAWSRNGKEILFTASEGGSNQAPLYAVTTDGRMRLIYRTAGNLVLQDIARNGDLLINEDNRRREMYVMTPNDKTERNLSWFDWSFPRDLSEDGKNVLFIEQGAGGGSDYSIYIRDTNGSPAVRLGEGVAIALSPDGKWALSSLPSEILKPVLLPTGVGEPRTVNLGGLESYLYAGHGTWFSDGNRIITTANEKGKLPRIFLLDINTGKHVPITPEGVTGAALISFDEKSILAPTADRGFAFYPLNGGAPVPFPALQQLDVPLTWTSDGRSLYVSQRKDPAMNVYLVDVAGGQRKLWKEVTASDPAGVTAITLFLITPDGKTYIYTTRKALADLYLATGIQ